MYDGDLVAIRERMFDALESHLHSIERELELLYRLADRVIADPPAASQPGATDDGVADRVGRHRGRVASTW